MATHPGILAWRIPKDRGTWRTTVHRVPESQTQLKQLSTQEVIKLKQGENPESINDYGLQYHQDRPSSSRHNSLISWFFKRKGNENIKNHCRSCSCDREV